MHLSVCTGHSGRQWTLCCTCRDPHSGQGDLSPSCWDCCPTASLGIALCCSLAQGYAPSGGQPTFSDRPMGEGIKAVPSPQWETSLKGKPKFRDPCGVHGSPVIAPRPSSSLCPAGFLPPPTDGHLDSLLKELPAPSSPSQSTFRGTPPATRMFCKISWESADLPTGFCQQVYCLEEGGVPRRRTDIPVFSAFVGMGWGWRLDLFGEL